MRLINTHTLELEEFYGTEIPKYAILSHTWLLGREEVTFQEWLGRETQTSVWAKSGYTKILAACRVVRQDSLDWLWVDTNCIDKTSSAELTEAMNSMYEWYRESVICHACLSNVSTPRGPEGEQGCWEQFSRSRWWTRGRRAPWFVFFTQEWDMSWNRESIASKIEQISGISQKYLNGQRPPHTTCGSEIAASANLEPLA
ncbi:HET-domain-containing protein [Xylaria acuta]|nr:HET-domain-containing protein [Xylaria acuta]